MLMAASSTPASESRSFRPELNGRIPRNKPGCVGSCAVVLAVGGGNLRVYLLCRQISGGRHVTPVNHDTDMVESACIVHPDFTAHIDPAPAETVILAQIESGRFVYHAVEEGGA